jgi:hypothetical protein
MESLVKDSFKLEGEVMWIKHRNGVEVERSGWQKNTVLSGSNRGISLFLDRLINITTYTGVISHAEIGDDNTAAIPSQSGLLNPLVRTSVGLTAASGLTRDFRFFFTDALTPNDTYHEFGMIVDGTGTIGTGVTFNRLVFGSPLVKAAGESITIVCRITGSV